MGSGFASGFFVVILLSSPLRAVMGAVPPNDSENASSVSSKLSTASANPISWPFGPKKSPAWVSRTASALMRFRFRATDSMKSSQSRSTSACRRPCAVFESGSVSEKSFFRAPAKTGVNVTPWRLSISENSTWTAITPTLPTPPVRVTDTRLAADAIA